jgi:hypothetical protein
MTTEPITALECRTGSAARRYIWSWSYSGIIQRRARRQAVTPACQRCHNAAVKRAQAAVESLPRVIAPAAMERITASVGRRRLCGLERAEWMGPGVRLCETNYQRESRRAVEAGAEVVAEGYTRRPSLAAAVSMTAILSRETAWLFGGQPSLRRTLRLQGRSACTAQVACADCSITSFFRAELR